MHIMPVPSASFVFNAGLRNGTSQSESLEFIVQRQLGLLSRELEMNTPPPSSSDSEDLVSELGEYFTRTAAMWAQLTQYLVKGPHITQAAVKACERSQAMSHMSDLGELAKIDVDLSKLKYVFTKQPNLHPTNPYIPFVVHAPRYTEI